MVVVIQRENEDVEWVDEDYLDLNGIKVHEEHASESVLPIITLSEYLSSLWKDAVEILKDLLNDLFCL